MKKTLLAVLFFSAVLMINAQTQPTSSSGSYRNIFKVSAAMFTRNTFQMGIEHYFTPTTSFQLNAGMNFRDSETEETWGIGTEVQLKFHVFTQIEPKKSNRLYFAPYITNNYQERKSNVWKGSVYEWTNDSFDAVGTGILFGWSFSFANRINLDIYTGGGIRKAFNVDSDFSNGIWNYGYSGIAPRLGVDVGFWL
jgi:hypothetical protein